MIYNGFSCYPCPLFYSDWPNYINGHPFFPDLTFNSFYGPVPNTCEDMLNFDNNLQNSTATQKTVQFQPKKEQSYEWRTQGENKLISISRQKSCRTISNHNVLPNKINLVLSFLRRINKSGKIVEKIIRRINKEKKDFTVKKYYAYQFYLKENLDGFTHRNAIANLITHCNPASSIFTVQEQLFYNKVCRILISYYLRQISTFQVLHRRKLKNSSIIDHFVIHRYLKEILRGTQGQPNLSSYKL